MPPTPAPTPLPTPELTTIDEVTQLVTQRGAEDQGVVSMLKLLGIGSYNEEGSPIVAGTEASDADLYLFDPEVRGLIQFAREWSGDESDWMTFRDFQASLAGLGFKGSAEDLANAYTTAYDDEPDTPMSKLIYSMGGVDVDGKLAPLQAWLLFVDGFVPSHSASAKVASTNPLQPDAKETGWGVAHNNVQALSPVPLEADPLVIAHLMIVVRDTTLEVKATPDKLHEGHGGTGAPATISANIRAYVSSFMSPFSQQPLIPVSGVASGVPIQWQLDPALDKHSSLPIDPFGVTDSLGTASFQYTPRQEEANGQGYETLDVGIVRASVPADLLVTQLYGMPSLGALVGTAPVTNFAVVDIGYHVLQAMHVSLSEDYDVQLGLVVGQAHRVGRDAFDGTLEQQPDGTWEGVVTGTTAGHDNTSVFGQDCSNSWSASQQVRVIGQASPDAINGDFYFKFIPVTNPTGSLGGGLCPETTNSYQGVDYAPYNDFSITDAADDQGLVIYMPPPPGGARDYATKEPGLVDATWHVTIEYLQPQ